MKSSENCRLVSLPHFESLTQDDPDARQDLHAARACLNLARGSAEPCSIMVVLWGDRPVGMFMSRVDAPPLIELIPGILLNEDAILSGICAELEVAGVL